MIFFVPILTEIKTTVDEAIEYRENKEFKKAKNKFLDAAQLALAVYKNASENVEKLSYENIARSLITEAKAVQEEIFLAELPKVPEKIEKEKSLEDQLIIRKRPLVYHIWVIKEGGTPIISHPFEKMGDIIEGKIDEIRFSGAISAISALMYEAIERPIQTINFDEGVMIIHKHKNLSYVLFVQAESPGLNKALNKFCEQLEKQSTEDIQSATMALDLSDDEITLKLIQEYFPQ